MNRVTIRPFAAAALAAILAVAAVPAVHALPAEGGTVVASPTGLLQMLTDWIGSIFATSGTEADAGPEMDPNGPQAGPDMDPDGLEAGPGMDPDGSEGEAGPHMDPNG